MRSGWISASTMTANGLDIFRVVEEEYNLFEVAMREGLLGELKAWEERSKRRQALLESTFMLFISCSERRSIGCVT